MIMQAQPTFPFNCEAMKIAASAGPAARPVLLQQGRIFPAGICEANAAQATKHDANASTLFHCSL
jgi:hypothetical protein